MTRIANRQNAKIAKRTSKLSLGDLGVLAVEPQSSRGFYIGVE
jgi:hypothetical protein